MLRMFLVRYGLGLTGLRVTILGPLYFAAPSHFASSDGGL
jgi:hypothetical protein